MRVRAPPHLVGAGVPDGPLYPILQPGQCPFSLCSCKEKVDKKRKHAKGGEDSDFFPPLETP